ncbi:MAG: DUF5667 domain-containing protein, partial [Alkalibacterium sp.]|uniref:DUF5667 domain-containing protein n=1 Tax=Alkalibacterium sp. TaxID=1872447 RepID=UPI003970FAF1
MMKKRIYSLVLGTGLILGSSQALAAEMEDVVNPDSELYDTTRVMEEIEYDLTDDAGDQALLQDGYAVERVAESELALESGDVELAEDLLEEANESTDQAEADLNDAIETEDESVEEVEKTLAESLEARTMKLRTFLDREDLPEQAKIGISRALKQVGMVVKRAEERTVLQTKLAAGELTEEEFESE